jgi:tRNA 2-(methylsulfanyl)-N6-isopentenyladenosine37 hydroxylase
MRAAVATADALGLLACATPEAWFTAALEQLPQLLIDHANCERKAAGTALSLMYRYTEVIPLQRRLSRLAREELRHFEQVLGVLARDGIAYRRLSPSRYAASLRHAVRTWEPARLIDSLIVGALIEARSCERFAGLAQRLAAGELQTFYGRLLSAEARHCQEYLALARQLDGSDLEPRIAVFRTHEQALILGNDPELRFHSGVPS